MKPKYRRLYWTLSALVLIGSGIALALITLRNEVIFFVTPSELLKASSNKPSSSLLRLGGYVQPKSLSQEGLNVKFQVTDF